VLNGKAVTLGSGQSFARHLVRTRLRALRHSPPERENNHDLCRTPANDHDVMERGIGDADPARSDRGPESRFAIELLVSNQTPRQRVA
jgi:hypothetical protein